MSTKRVMEELAKVPLFSDCSNRDLQTISRVVKDIDHRAGTVIAREGEPGVGLFVIVDGEAEVTIGGKKKATLGPASSSARSRCWTAALVPPRSRPSPT